MAIRAALRKTAAFIPCGNAREPSRISGVIISIMRHARLAVATLLLCFTALRSAAAIQGTVMTTDGQPVAGARVSTIAFETPDARRQRLLSAAPEEVPLATALTDAKGNFSLASPKEPAVALSVFMRGYLPVQRRVEREEEVGAIALLKSEFQTGTITAAGKPLGGATIVLNYGGYEYVTKSGEDGKYTAPDPKRARSIAVLHPSYAISEEAFPFGAGGSASKLQRTLVPGAPLTGRVLGSDGKSPVPEATISLDGWPLASSGEDGAFTIPHAPAKWTVLVARKDALLGQRSFSNVASQDLRLSRAATISGRVTDARSKLPVAGTVVSAMPTRMDRADVAASAITDVKGGFTLLVLPASYRLVASHPAYDQKMSEAAGTSGQSVSKDLALTPLARATGIVVDEGNKPVTAAAITTEAASDPMGMPRMMRFGGNETASGPDGRFSIRFSGDEDLRLKAVKKGLPVAKSETLKLTPGERKSGIVLTIASGVPVSGRVTDREGKPLSGVAVTTAEAEPGRGGMQRIFLSNLQQFDDDAVRTASDGTFAMRLKEGTYDFAFRREGYATQHARAQTVTPTGENIVEAKLEPAVEVRGRVTRSGSGVEGVMIAAMVSGTDSRATSGPDGSFTLGGLTPGQVRISLRKDDDFVQEMRSVTAPASDFNIDLPAGSRVTGRVIDKATRKPVPQFQAGLSRSRSAGGMVMMSPPQLKGFTSDDGSFVLENVPPGAHDLVASAAGFASGRLNINVEEGKALSGLEIELDTGTRLIGKVTGPTGTPLSDVRVSLSGGPGGAMARMGMGASSSSTVTDANGEYTLEALASGDETIEFSHQKYLRSSKSVSLKGREVRLDVQLEGGQRVTGIVVTESGAPVADAEVFAFASGASRRSVRSNASGMFEFDSLAPARYRFGAGKSGYSEGRVDDFDITSGVPLRITLKTGGTIYGRVSGLTPAELSNVSVDARAGGSGASANVDSSGNYKIEGAPTGTVQVSATMMSSAMTGRRTTPTQTVQLDAGGSRQLDFEFASGTVIRGRVTRNGVPLKGASISFTPRTGRTLAASSGSTDEEGMYSIAGLDDAEYNVNVMDLQRFGSYSTTYQVTGSATFNIDYKANVLRGRVIDAMTNTPLANANVQLRSADSTEGFRGAKAATTDAGGTFVLDVTPGSYIANASKDGYGNDSRTVMIGDRQPEDLEFKISRSEGVTLKVVDARGGRSLDASASVYNSQGQLVPDSRMPFPISEGGADLKLNLAPGRYTASVSAFGYATRTIAFDSPSVQTVPMTPGGTLMVRSKQSTRARVRLIDSSGAPYPRSSMRPTWFDLSPSPGTTPIEHIAPGTYTLQLLGDNDSVLDSERVTISEGQTTSTEM